MLPYTIDYAAMTITYYLRGTTKNRFEVDADNSVSILADSRLTVADVEYLTSAIEAGLPEKPLPEIILGQHIERFLNSSETEMEVPMHPIRTYEKAFVALGFEKLDLDGEETNGWQVDFWYPFHQGETTITLVGSLHCGNFKLRKDED